MTAWKIEIERFEKKDGELPEAMQAEVICERRARIIKAEAEF